MSLCHILCLAGWLDIYKQCVEDKLFTLQLLSGWLVGFYGILNLRGQLMPNPVHTYDFFLFVA